jgi:enamine deaminase RidA (YjgF/YER057c/UK114 family)
MEQRQRVPARTQWGSIVGYSRAVRVGQHVFVGGTTAALEGGGAVGGNDVAAQTAEVLRRIEAALSELGAELAHVVRTRIFVTDIDSWEAVGRVHGEHFESVPPASTMVQVAALIDPVLLVEIEADAVLAV